MPFRSRRESAAVPRDPLREKRLAWFREAKFGLFIHWGLYAIPAGQWQGRMIPGLGEWIMRCASIPVREYEQLAAQYNPVEFDAEAWAQLARDAGMKYVVITAKHHDGFALFKSAVSPYNVVDATPFGRDIVAELARACARHQLPLGFYYSHAQDWHEPNGFGNTWDFGPEDRKDYDQYLRTKSEPQIRELLSGYGPVALLWFDSPRMMTPERSRRFADLVRSIQPDTLIDGRLGIEGDYRSTPDNVIPPEATEEAWETPATINRTWGFRADDDQWKPPARIVFNLVDVVSKGGNYLLNVGPMANGVVPQASQDVLRAVGRWLHANGAAVYGAKPTPFGSELRRPNGHGGDAISDGAGDAPIPWRVTAKPGTLYFTFFGEPRAPFPLPPMTNAVKRAHRAADRAPVDLTWERDRTVMHIHALEPDPLGTVVAVEVEGDEVEPIT